MNRKGSSLSAKRGREGVPELAWLNAPARAVDNDLDGAQQRGPGRHACRLFGGGSKENLKCSLLI
jgi:hypothetical protein